MLLPAQPALAVIVLLAAIIALASCGIGPESLHQSGRQSHDAGQLDLAIEYYRRSIELDASRADVFIDLAAAYYDRGDVVEASLACERALQIAPGSIRASALLGRAYLEFGRAEEALPFALRGTQTPAPGVFALSTLAAVFLDLKRYEDAERLYGMAIASNRYPESGVSDVEGREVLSPEDTGYLYFGIGLSCKGQGKFREASAWYDTALVYLPREPGVVYEKGILLERSGRWREALECYRQVIKADPLSIDARVRASVALFYLGELLTARDMLLSARDDSSAGPEAAYTLGRIAEERGFILEAIDYYQEARWIDESMAPAWLREGLLRRSIGLESEGTQCLEMARQAGSSAARRILESEAARSRRQ